MKFFILLRALSISFFTSLALNAFAAQMPNLDSEFVCLDQQTANQYIRDFNIDTASFGGIELCDNQKDTKKLFNDLSILHNGQFSSSEPNLLIRNFIPADRYYTWMASQTRGVARGNDVPFATAYNSGGYFTMQDGWATLSTLGRVGTIVHEARHTQGYIHIQCTFGPYANSSVSGCDRNYDYGGSHAIEMEYYARVSEQGTNFHPVYQSMARLMAMGRSNFVFNQSPIQKKTHLLVITSDNMPLYLDEQKWIQKNQLTQTPLKLKRTSFGANIFTGTSFIALDLYRNVTSNIQISDDYSYFKLFKQKLGQDPLVSMSDFEEVDKGQRRYFVYLNKNQKMSSYVFPQGKWGQLAQAPVAGQFINTLPDGSEGLFLKKDSAFYQIDPQTLASQTMNIQWPQEITQYAVSSEGQFSLDQNGVLSSVNHSFSTPLPGFEKTKIILMTSVPSYNAFEVK